MIFLLATFAVAVVVMGWLDLRKVASFDSFVLAGRSRSTLTVTASMLASVVGASATLGVVDMARSCGTPAFWWLGSGAVGLVLAGVLIARRLRSGNYKTLADLVGVHYGTAARRIVSVTIVLGWGGITAAQFVAAADVVSTMSGWSYIWSLILAGGFITAYCAMGGQASVLKTDVVQLVLMLAAIAVTLCLLYGRSGAPTGGFEIEIVNKSFGWSSWGYFMLIVGSGFIVGPDVFSRLFTARNETVAMRASIFSGVLLAVVSAAIVAIGLWARHFGDIPDGVKTLPYLLSNTIGGSIGAALGLGLLAAIISSADTCMISASTACEHDLLGGASVGRARIITVAIGIAAIVIAACVQDIIGTLILAYSLFNCGVIPPVLVALLYRGSRKPSGAVVIAAIITGGGMGVAGKLLDMKLLSAGGMFCSAAISVLSYMLASGGDGASKGAAATE